MTFEVDVYTIKIFKQTSQKKTNMQLKVEEDSARLFPNSVELLYNAQQLMYNK